MLEPEEEEKGHRKTKAKNGGKRAQGGKEKQCSVLGSSELAPEEVEKNDYTAGNWTVISQPQAPDKPDPRK